MKLLLLVSLFFQDTTSMDTIECTMIERCHTIKKEMIIINLKLEEIKRMLKPKGYIIKEEELLRKRNY